MFAIALAVAGGPAGTRGAQRSNGLPDRLTPQEFWELSLEFSEPDATFYSDNLVSNEMSFAQVLPQLRASVSPGGVYIGVGPEQNFSYLAALESRFGFIVDIRRGNLLLHLMYKAIFDLSPDRPTFLARLFSRAAPNLRGTPSIADLMDWFVGAPQDSDETYRQKVEEVLRVLLDRYELPLTREDVGGIEQVHGAFRRFGPNLGYATTQIGKPFGQATYANLMKQSNARGEPLGFLGSEASYRFVRDLQLRHVIIPVVGNFAGPKAIRAIGSYLRGRNAAVTAFYLSNVEDYLGLERIPKNGEWSVFCENAAALPRDARSVFIRPLGLALFGSDGSLTLARDMQIGDRSDEAVRLPPSPPPRFPSALSTIADDVKACGG